jgi:long-chain fatty acid transport protein
MNRKCKMCPVLNLAVCVAILVLVAQQVYATGFRNPPDSASALGRDGGKIAHIDDASAVTHNPANLTDIKETQILAPLTLIYSKAEFDSPAGSAETREPWKVLPSLHLAVPMKDGEWVAGFAVTTPFGQSTEWSKNSLFRYSAPYFSELRVINFNPTLATELGDQISVGFGLDVFYSDLDLRQSIPWSAVVGLPVPDGRTRLLGEGTGGGGNFGVTYKVTERQRLAMTYRTPVEVEYDGDTKVGNVPAPLSGAVAGRSDFDTEIDFPAILAVGYGLAVNEAVRIGFDVEWVEYSRFQSLPIDVGVNNASGLFPPSVPQRWEDSWTFGVGGDWKANDRVVLRAGYKFLESPIPDKTHSPILPDADRHLLTVGCGYLKGPHRLDLAYGYTIFEDRDVKNSPVPPFNGEYDLTSHLIGMSYGYTF